MTERYRCQPGATEWHSTPLCSQWPRIDYWSHRNTPHGGHLCPECAQLEQRRDSAGRPLVDRGIPRAQKQPIDRRLIHQPFARVRDLVIETAGHWPDAVASLVRDLPEWFGIAQSVASYIDAASELPNTIARQGHDVLGVCLTRRHTRVAAEIELLAVRRDLHRRGIGRELLERVDRDLRAAGVRLLEVKTFGPSGESKEYERTRAFYESMGFLPLEERRDIWGPEDPCLISVKPLD